MTHSRRLLSVLAVAGLLTAVLCVDATRAQDHGQKHGADVTKADGWIVEDLEAGYALAKETGKPLLIAFR